MALTDRQKRILRRIKEGAKVKALQRADPPNRWYFTSEEDGICATLYLCLTMRSLLKRGLINATNGKDCTLSKKGIECLEALGDI